MARATRIVVAVLLIVPAGLVVAGSSSGQTGCDPSYPGQCIPSPPPELDCDDVPFSNFPVLPPDPHDFDRDNDGFGCETSTRPRFVGATNTTTMATTTTTLGTGTTTTTALATTTTVAGTAATTTTTRPTAAPAATTKAPLALTG